MSYNLPRCIQAIYSLFFSNYRVCVGIVTVSVVLGSQMSNTCLLSKYGFFMWQIIIMTLDQIGLRFFKLWRPVLCFLHSASSCRLISAFFCTCIDWLSTEKTVLTAYNADAFGIKPNSYRYETLSGLFFPLSLEMPSSPFTCSAEF